MPYILISTQIRMGIEGAGIHINSPDDLARKHSWTETCFSPEEVCGVIHPEVGPTMVGDEHSDPNLMNYLGATKRNMLGNHFWEYYVQDAPRIVLDKLEKCGYRVISMTGVGQTLVWCLHKESIHNSNFLPA